MPKLKTNKAASKRYGFTAKGKVKRTSANARHRLSTKMCIRDRARSAFCR